MIIPHELEYGITESEFQRAVKILPTKPEPVFRLVTEVAGYKPTCDTDFPYVEFIAKKVIAARVGADRRVIERTVRECYAWFLCGHIVIENRGCVLGSHCSVFIIDDQNVISEFCNDDMIPEMWERFKLKLIS